MILHERCSAADDGRYTCRTCGRPITEGQDCTHSYPELWDAWPTTWYHLACVARKCVRCRVNDAYPLEVHEKPGFHRPPVCEACERAESDAWDLGERPDITLWPVLRILIYRQYLSDQLWSVLGNTLSLQDWAPEGYEEPETKTILKLRDKFAQTSSYAEPFPRKDLIDLLSALAAVYSLPKSAEACGRLWTPLYTRAVSDGLQLEGEPWKNLLRLIRAIRDRLAMLDDTGYTRLMAARTTVGFLRLM